MRANRLRFEMIAEPQPGLRWQAFYQRMLPAYTQWFLSQGDQARPRYLTAFTKFKQYFPELLPIYQQLVTLAGGGDMAARLLALWCPPPYMSACSQIVWHQQLPYSLLRNYDYAPHLFEATVLKTYWLKPVICMSDCLWGCLDGINADGLCLSLTFGGSRTVGTGFGIPLALRYILETCTTTAQAAERLTHIPVHMAYNVTVLDAQNQFRTIYLKPDHPPEIHLLAVATNHQQTVEWKQYAQTTATIERFELLSNILQQSEIGLAQVKKLFFTPPLYNNNFDKGFGTLYHAHYYPNQKSVTFAWPDRQIPLSFDAFDERIFEVNLSA
jgi:predicted choloylglycine hydrolase